MAPPYVFSISGMLSTAHDSQKVYRYDSEGRVNVIESCTALADVQKHRTLSRSVAPPWVFSIS